MFDGQLPNLPAVWKPLPGDRWEHGSAMKNIFVPARLSRTPCACLANLHSTRDSTPSSERSLFEALQDEFLFLTAPGQPLFAVPWQASLDYPWNDVWPYTCWVHTCSGHLLNFTLCRSGLKLTHAAVRKSCGLHAADLMPLIRWTVLKLKLLQGGALERARRLRKCGQWRSRATLKWQHKDGRECRWLLVCYLCFWGQLARVHTATKGRLTAPSCSASGWCSTRHTQHRVARLWHCEKQSPCVLPDQGSFPRCHAAHVMPHMSGSTAWGYSWTSQYKATCLYPEVAMRVPGTTSPSPAITEGMFHAFWGSLSHGEFAIYCVMKQWEDWLWQFALVATLIT